MNLSQTIKVGHLISRATLMTSLLALGACSDGFQSATGSTASSSLSKNSMSYYAGGSSVAGPAVAGMPSINASLSAISGGEDISYSISNLDNMNDQYSINILSGSSQIANIYQCHAVGKSCTVGVGTDLPFLFSSYLQSKPSGLYNLVISATNSRGTVTQTLAFNYSSPSAAPAVAPAAAPASVMPVVPAPIASQCVSGRYWDDIFTNHVDFEHVCVDNSPLPLLKNDNPGPPEFNGARPALIFDGYSTNGNPSGVSYDFTNFREVGDRITIDVTDSHGFFITNIYITNNVPPSTAGGGISSGLYTGGKLSFTPGFSFSHYLPGQPAGTYQIHVQATNKYATRGVLLPFTYTP